MWKKSVCISTAWLAGSLKINRFGGRSNQRHLAQTLRPIVFRKELNAFFSSRDFISTPFNVKASLNTQKWLSPRMTHEYLIKANSRFKVQIVLGSHSYNFPKCTAFCSFLYQNENHSFICWLPNLSKPGCKCWSKEKCLGLGAQLTVWTLHSVHGSLGSSSTLRKKGGNCANRYQFLKRGQAGTRV